MVTGGQKRTRSERVAALELPPSRWEQVWASMLHREMLARLGVSLVAAVAICAVIRGWDPPFRYRAGYTPEHDIAASFPFSVESPRKPRNSPGAGAKPCAERVFAGPDSAR